MKRTITLLLSLVLCFTLCSCKSKAATDADDLICSIGEVTSESGNAIQKAETAVDALSEKDCEQLEHLDELKSARARYDDLVDRDKAEQLIVAINNVKDNITLDSKDAIYAVRTEYNASNSRTKDYVTNYDDFEQAEKTLSNLMIEDPWGIHRETQPGEEKYKKIVSAKENDSLKCAFTSLESEGILTWSEYTMFVPDIQTEADGATITRALTEQEWKKRNQERLEYISELSSEENCVLSVETFEAGIGDYESWNTNYYMNDQQPEQQQANPEEEAMYLNYQAYIRQLTVKLCKKQKEFVPVNQIPNKYEIFSDWKYRRQYLDLDKKYRLQLLGWKSAWSEYQFEVINEAKAAKYDKGNAQDLASKLAVEYINYMETQMDKDCIYFAEGCSV